MNASKFFLKAANSLVTAVVGIVSDPGGGVFRVCTLG